MKANKAQELHAKSDSADQIFKQKWKDSERLLKEACSDFDSNEDRYRGTAKEMSIAMEEARDLYTQTVECIEMMYNGDMARLQEQFDREEVVAAEQFHKDKQRLEDLLVRVDISDKETLGVIADNFNQLIDYNECDMKFEMG